MPKYTGLRSTARAVLLAMLSVTAGAASSVATAASAAAEAKVRVESFEVSGNTLLPARVIDAALVRWQGQRTLAELQEAARTLQGLYAEAGYGAVVAWLPEQSVTGGRVQLRVLEGKVSRVTVTGAERNSVESIRRAVPGLQEGQTPRIVDLDAQIQFANDTPARQLALTLEAGGQPGEVDARVVVSEQPPSAWTVALDNTGNAQTGRVRVAVGWRHAALWGLDHQASVQYQTSLDKPSAVSIVSGSYSVPLYGPGLRLDLYAARSDVDGGTTATAVGPLQFVGKGNVAGLRLSKLLPRLGAFDQRLALGLDRREYLNNCRIEGLPDGACGAAGESVAVSPVSVEYTVQRGGERPLGANVSLMRNLAMGGRHGDAAAFEAARAGAPRDYTVLRSGGFMAWPTGDSGKLQARVLAQFTGDALVSGEQFGLAGAQVVRGYAEREVTGDSAVLLGLDWFGSERVIESGRWLTGWRWTAFAEAGTVRNRNGAECLAGASRCTLGALGVGWRGVGQGVQWRADLAVPLKDGNSTEKNEPRLHVSAQFEFQ